MPNHSTDGRADATRGQILRAASHQFARRPYHDVGLDDILADAALTKGAMYFHFKSKYALAVAIIDKQSVGATAAVRDLSTRGMSGLETLIDFSYLIGVQDIQSDLVRAALNLIESVGQSDGLQDRLFNEWIEALGVIVAQGIAEGDIAESCGPQDLGRMLLSLHMGLRKTSDLDDPARFLGDIERCWHLLLSGILAPDRMDYFRQFVRRRTGMAVNACSADDEA